jgi:hypothetical protein
MEPLPPYPDPATLFVGLSILAVGAVLSLYDDTKQHALPAVLAGFALWALLGRAVSLPPPFAVEVIGFFGALTLILRAAAAAPVEKP